MSTVRIVKVTCAMCKNVSEQNVLGSTSSFGAMDLDTRPPALERYTLAQQIQVCPHCGYVNSEIAMSTSVNPDFIKSSAYKNAEGNRMHWLAMAFYSHAMIAREEGNDYLEFMGYLRAAWACDDDDDAVHAAVCRQKALEVLERAPEGSIIPHADSAAMMRADLLRRTKQFEKVLEYKHFKTDNNFIQTLMKYEIKLAKKKDAACHRVDEA